MASQRGSSLNFLFKNMNKRDFFFLHQTLHIRSLVTIQMSFMAEWDIIQDFHGRILYVGKSISSEEVTVCNF